MDSKQQNKDDGEKISDKHEPIWANIIIDYLTRAAIPKIRLRLHLTEKI